MSKNLSPNKKYDYQVLDDSTLMITQYYGKDAELETPRKIGHMNVSRIGNRAFSGCNTLKQVTISNGVTCIENHAFTDCEQLTSIMIPDTVKSIGEALFDDCPQLEKITVANCSGTCYELDIKRIKYNDRTRARSYTCPYCGVKIMPEQVLFWETQRASYKDTVRSDFLRHHGVHVWSGFFNRIYYKTKLGINVVLEDENGFPTAIEDSINNAIEPEYIHIPKIRPDHNSRIGKAFDLDFSDDTFDIDDDFYDRDEDRENNDTFDFDTEDFEESLVSFSKKTDFGVHTITQRACPFCHCELPKQFGTLDTYHIAVWGGNASGKTAYLLSLFQQLNTQLKTNDLGRIELENESTAYISALLERYERFETTNATTIDDVLPIVCRYHNKMKDAYIILYEIPSEGMGDENYLSNHRGIPECDEVLLMIDPNMFSTKYASKCKYNHDSELVSDCCIESLHEIISSVYSLIQGHAQKVKSLVAVITKLDMIIESDWGYFSDHCKDIFDKNDFNMKNDISFVNNLRNDHYGALSLACIKQIENDIDDYFDKKEGIDLKKELRQALDNEIQISVLGVSVSTSDVFQSFKYSCDAHAEKHRIIEPFLMALMDLNLIPEKKDDNKIIWHIRHFDEADQLVKRGAPRLLKQLVSITQPSYTQNSNGEKQETSFYDDFDF